MSFSNFKNKLLNVFKINKNLEQSKQNEIVEDDEVKEYSKFREHLFFIDDEEQNEIVNQVVDLCDDNLKLVRHRTFLIKKKKELDIILKDLKYYNELSKEEAEELKSLLNKFVQVNNEKKSLRLQIDDFNSSIDRLETFEKDAYDAICQIEEAENQKKILKRDIEIIKQENERTKKDREKLEFAYRLIYKFSLSIALILGFSIVFLTLVNMILGQSVLFALVILGFVLLITIILIYLFRQKIVFELKLNEKKQIKIVALLNKKTVVYSYYINFLNYEYEKYNVKSAKSLKVNLSDFSNYKQVTVRYDNIRKILFEIQKQLELFIKEKNITIKNSSLESFAKSINVDNKRSYFKEINQNKEKIEQRITEIDKQQEDIWEKLVNFNLNDKSKDKVVEKIINSYILEAEKVSIEVDREFDLE